MAAGKKNLQKEEKNGMTCFNILALMPSVFSSATTGTFTKLIYFPPSERSLDDEKDEDDDEEKLSSGDQGQYLEKGKDKKDNIRQAKNQTRFPTIKKIWKERRKHESALELAKLLAKQDTSWKQTCKTHQDAPISLGLDKIKARDHKTDQNEVAGKGDNDDVSKEKIGSGTEAPLIMAASNGITQILEEILHNYPQAVDYITENGKNILHAAIKFRRRNIFDRILRMEKKVVEKLAAGIDIDGYTVLHHAADMHYFREATRSGPALQYQEELEWFQLVKEIMPSHYVMHRNKKKTTASDFFKEEHAMQLEKAQKWMKNTAESCSTVAILVATVVFAAANTVPGGNNEKGIPVFLHSPLFWVFTIMDVVSLISSLSSVVMFLSILTSPYNPDAFLKSLPRKLAIGFSLLFFSVLSSMITFTAALLLRIRLKRRWTATLVYVAAFIPVVLFALMQFPFHFWVT